MRRYKKRRCIGLEAQTAAELGDMITTYCDRLEDRPEIVWNLQNGNSVFLMYEELIEEPLTAKERSEHAGVVRHCYDCPRKKLNTDGRTSGMYKCDRRRPPGITGEEEACNWFYQMIEEGEIEIE